MVNFSSAAPPSAPVASEYLVNLWRARTVRNDVAEHRLLQQTKLMKYSMSKSGKKHDFKPGYLDLAKVTLTDVPVIVLVVLVAVVQVLNIVGYFTTFSMFVDDLTTGSDPGAGAAPGVVKDEVIIILFLLGLLAGVLIVLKSILLDLGGERLAVQMRTSLMRTVTLRPMEWFDEQEIPKLINCLGPRVNDIRDKFFKAQVSAFWGITMVMTGMMTLGILSAEALAVTVAFVPILAFSTLLHSVSLKNAERRFKNAAENCDFESSEFVDKIRTIRSCGTSRKELSDYLASLTEMYDYFFKICIGEAVYKGITTFLASSTLCVLIWFEGTLVEDQIISVGVTITCLVVSAFALTYFKDVAANISAVSTGLRNSGYVLETLNRSGGKVGEKVKPVSGEWPLALPRPDDVTYLFEGEPADFSEADAGKVEFDQVSFYYASAPKYQILRDFHLTIEAGSVTALMGNSGEGKTTVAQMLLRFYMPNQGTVKVDGKPIADYDISYCSQVGYLPGDPVIFSGTIKHNICYGCDITDESMIQAAKFADAHRFITFLDHGYDSIVGDANKKLSSGQRQRISVARLFARNPAIAVLDDPCSGFDDQEAAPLRTAIRRMLRYPVRRTGLLIAKEKEDMEFVDNIALLENQHVMKHDSRENMEKDVSSPYYKICHPY